MFFFERENAKATLVLLHINGDDENSLLSLADLMSDQVNVLGVRRDVLENGLPRFFLRLAEGVFDLEDLADRTKQLGVV